MFNDRLLTNLTSSDFPNYLVFNQAEKIQSTLNTFDIESCKRQLKIKNFKTYLIKELIRHKNTPEAPNKFFKDNEDETNYRFFNIKSASSTVIDDIDYFSLRINQLVVNNLQIGLSLSAPNRIMLSSYYQFLLEYRIPAIHILLRKERYPKIYNMILNN